ncbi:hypothetical protein GCM10020331_082700 [Ectobacillus funiculus]
MHFNKEAGAFVSSHDGVKQGDYVDTFDAGYTLEALRIFFERAIDGLPVGYASGEDAKGLQTEEGKLALEMMKKTSRLYDCQYDDKLWISGKRLYNRERTG